jgi:hypothetical protein
LVDILALSELFQILYWWDRSRVENVVNAVCCDKILSLNIGAQCSFLCTYDTIYTWDVENTSADQLELDFWL